MRVDWQGSGFEFLTSIQVDRYYSIIFFACFDVMFSGQYIVFHVTQSVYPQ